MTTEATTPLPTMPVMLEDLLAQHNANVPALIREMAALRRALDAAKLSPCRQLTEAALIIAVNRIRDVEHVELGISDLIAKAAMVRRLEQMHEARQAALTPEPEVSAIRHRHRAPRAERNRHLFPVTGGFAFPAAAAFRGLRLVLLPLHSLFTHKVLLTAGAGSALIGAALVSMPASHTLEDVIHLGHRPSASVPYIGPWGATPITLPSSASAPTAYVRPTVTPEPRKVLALDLAPVPVPVVTASDAAPDPVPQVSLPDQSGQPDQPSPSGQSSRSSQSSSPSDWSRSDQVPSPSLPDQTSYGRHAAQDSGPGNSGYQGQHQRSNGGGWQGGQVGGSKSADSFPQQQQGGNGEGNWQDGGQQGGHGQFGGASNRPSPLPGNFSHARV